jgi:hypothetical protein
VICQFSHGAESFPGFPVAFVGSRLRGGLTKFRATQIFVAVSRSARACAPGAFIIMRQTACSSVSFDFAMVMLPQLSVVSVLHCEMILRVGNAVQEVGHVPSERSHQAHYRDQADETHDHKQKAHGDVDRVFH